MAFRALSEVRMDERRRYGSEMKDVVASTDTWIKTGKYAFLQRRA
jgi:hypothetical protein